MGVKLAAASGGSIELVPTNTASNFTITVPAATTTVVGTDTTQTLTNKTLTTPIIDSAQVATVSGTAPLYMCRAWVMFDGTLAGTNAPTAGGNVTSVTRTGTGQYTVNLTVAMPSANYTVVSGGKEVNTSYLGGYGPQDAPTTTSFNVAAVDAGGSYTNVFTRMRFAIFG